MKLVGRINHLVHEYLLGFLLVAYAIAIAAPGPGVALRGLKVAGESAPHLMLGWLLFNAGFGIRFAELRSMHRRVIVILAGLVANVAVPIAYLFLLSVVAARWPEAHEVQVILIGLLICAAMPIAGSSTAWAQNFGGSSLISLGLVLGSTALSPWITPLTFTMSRYITDANGLEVFARLGAGDSTSFLITTVVVPAALGIFVRARLSEGGWRRVAPLMRLLNLINLLLLNYSNASVSLPPALVNPDWDFLALIAVVCGVQCVLSFGMGWFLSRALRAPLSERVALMYGLGMKNTGTGLVLATTYLSTYPLVTLPLIFGNFEQQIIAGLIGRWLERRRRRASL